jgi:hypothetical protein
MHDQGVNPACLGAGDLYTSGWAADLSGPLLTQGGTFGGSTSKTQLGGTSALGAWSGLHASVKEITAMGDAVVGTGRVR